MSVLTARRVRDHKPSNAKCFWLGCALPKKERAARNEGQPLGKRSNKNTINCRKNLRLIGDRGGCAVELREGDGKLLVVTSGLIAKDSEGHRFAKEQGLVGVAAVMDSGVDAMTETDVMPKLRQFPVHGQLRTGVGLEREPIIGGHDRVGNDEIAVEEEFENSDTSAAHCAMPGGVGRMRGAAFGISLRKQIGSVFAKALLDCLRVEESTVQVAADIASLAGFDPVDES